MLTFIAVCVGILTVVHLTALALLIPTVLQVRRTAQAAETLAYRAEEQFAKFTDTTSRLSAFATTASSTWARVVALGLGVATTFWARRQGGAKVRSNGD